MTIATEDTVALFAAHTGYAARGIVYLLVGRLAALAAFGEGGQPQEAAGLWKVY